MIEDDAVKSKARRFKAKAMLQFTAPPPEPVGQ